MSKKTKARNKELVREIKELTVSLAVVRASRDAWMVRTAVVEEALLRETPEMGKVQALEEQNYRQYVTIGYLDERLALVTSLLRSINVDPEQPSDLTK